MILMKVYSFQFQRFTVQDKTSLCIKCDVADTSCGLIDINHLAVQTDTRFHLIEIRIGCAPQMRFTDLDTLLAPYGLFGFQTKCRGLTFANLLSVSIEQALYDFTLLDSQKKRVLFQQEVCDSLGFADVQCLHLRAEEAPAAMRESYDVVTSRAVARLNMLSELCLPFARVGGCFLAMKGPAAAEELEECRKAFSLLGGKQAELLKIAVPGLDAERWAVRVNKASQTPAGYPRRFAQIKKQPL